MDPLKNLLVLAVDDNKDNQELLTYWLEQVGAKPTIAESGQQALDMLSKSSFELILLDLRMPGMSGYDVLLELKKRGFQAPVIALSASSQQEEVQQARLAGFDGYLLKPLDVNELRKLVMKVKKA